ncbi:c-type cytochrome [Massilia glaciei]|uniref:Cytochrome c4 n=1 Tax=Massilia glaciei TaxID=1524097 RepID=A0A2U2I559_9BURK|nr:c-type cytochrome [Massilia glaciei]PWF54847.1 cytochrome c4 [Massilia glaciei]
MNRAFVSFVKVLLLAAIAGPGLASAADAPAAAVADAKKGAALYTGGDPARGLAACISCHGDAGNSTMAANPKLAGQIAAYTHKQLVDFTTPARANPVMTTFAKMLTAQEKKDVAAYLAAQTPKQGAAKNKELATLGKKIYRGGIAERGVAACASCHGASGAGIPAQYPRLAGQHPDYTIAQLQLFKGEKRKNSAQMTTLAKRMSDEEMSAVAEYVAGLK